MNYRNNNNCLVCNKKIEIEYLNLNDQPLANAFHIGDELQKYPLRIKVCDNCWHSQLSVSVDPTVMFDHYLYISDTSVTLNKYFDWATDYILENTYKPKNVLEIACNSGLLLEKFQNKGLTCYGVDPAKNIRELSEKRNLNVYVDYFNYNFSENFKKEIGKLDLILAFHVLPHVNDPNDFIKSCVNLLEDNGKIFIQTSQCDMLLNNEFDVIYHEHSSYFTGKSIRQLARNNNLYVSSIIKTDIHSKSFLFSLQKSYDDEKQLNDLIKFETENKIYDLEKYDNFRKNANKIKNDLLINLKKFRDEDYVLVGYGAAAKGNTLLNFIEYKLDYIIDDSYMKWNYLTPGTDIPIKSIDILKELKDEKICFIPLAWNFYTEIKSRIEKVRNTKNDVFIRYFPYYREENK